MKEIKRKIRLWAIRMLIKHTIVNKSDLQDFNDQVIEIQRDCGNIGFKEFAKLDVSKLDSKTYNVNLEPELKEELNKKMESDFGRYDYYFNNYIR